MPFPQTIYIFIVFVLVSCETDITTGLPEETHRLRQVSDAIEAAEGLSVTHRLILLAASDGATMSEVVDTVPDNDLVAYTAINELLTRGLLEVEEPQPVR